MINHRCSLFPVLTVMGIVACRAFLQPVPPSPLPKRRPQSDRVESCNQLRMANDALGWMDPSTKASILSSVVLKQCGRLLIEDYADRCNFYVDKTKSKEDMVDDMVREYPDIRYEYCLEEPDDCWLGALIDVYRASTNATVITVLQEELLGELERPLLWGSEDNLDVFCYGTDDREQILEALQFKGAPQKPVLVKVYYEGVTEEFVKDSRSPRIANLTTMSYMYAGFCKTQYPFWS